MDGVYRVCLSALAIAAALSLAGLGGCSSYRAGRTASNPDAADPIKPEYGYKVGKPYQIRGKRYTPAENFTYDKVGVASWYGTKFHGRKTANGEIYDKHKMTAAHRTLPMPSLVEVTNLANGRTVRLRVNDRGPFAHDRIIDVSRRAAERLGFLRAGTALVRVRVVTRESRRMKAIALRATGRPVPPELADALAPPPPKATAKVAPPPAPPVPPAAAPDNNVYAKRPNAAPPPVAVAPAAPASPDRDAVAAAPRSPVTSEALAPPPGAKSAPPPARRRVIGAGVAVPRSLVPRWAKPADPGASTGAPAAAAPAVPDGRAKAAAPAAATPAGTPGTPARPAGRIYVQAGTYAHKYNADRVRRELSRISPAAISTRFYQRKPFYRVRVGPVRTRAEGRQLLAKVIRRGYPDARIVVD